MKTTKKRRSVVYDGNKPSAIILDIASFEKLVEAAEDRDDLRFLAKLKKQPRDVMPLEEFLARRNQR